MMPFPNIAKVQTPIYQKKTETLMNVNARSGAIDSNRAKCCRGTRNVYLGAARTTYDNLAGAGACSRTVRRDITVAKAKHDGQVSNQPQETRKSDYSTISERGEHTYAP